MHAILLAALAATSISAQPPDPYAPPPVSGTPERLAWDALRGVSGADAAIERWLARNTRAPLATRAMLAHRLCLNYTRTIVGARRVAACTLEMKLDPTDDASALTVARILRRAPAIRVTGSATVRLTRSPTIRSRSIDGVGNGVSLAWIVDVGAGMSVLSETAAKRLGVRMLGGAVTAETATSNRPVGSVGMIDRMTIGGATIEHMPVLVLPDAALTFGGEVTSAILGLPALVAFGRVAWLDNGGRMALGAAAPAPSGNALKLYWHPDGVGIPIDLPGGTAGADFDSGAGASTLYLPGFSLLTRDQAEGAVFRDVQISGAGGMEKIRLRTLPRLTFRIGGVPIMVDKPNVEERTDRGAARIGNDMIDQLETFIMDFRTMTLSVEPKR